MGNGFDDGSDDVLLLAVREEEVEAGGEAVGMRDGGEEVESAVDGLEAQGSGGAFGEGVGEAGEEAGVTEILTESDGDVMCTDELHREVNGEARQPVEKGANGGHGSGMGDLMRHGTPGGVWAIYNLRGSWARVGNGGKMGRACYDHDRRSQRTLSGRGCFAASGSGRDGVR